MEFFGLLKWLDGSPLLSKIEPYRAKIFEAALDTLGDDGNPRFNLVLAGRAKKNWKSADLILAALYRLLAWSSPGGSQCYLLANDAGQAADDLVIASKLVRANPLLEREVKITKNLIERKDLTGFLEILPAGDVVGTHGKTYSFVGYDEIHGYRDWDILEALAPDPTRSDALVWVTSYASIFNHVGVPLHDMMLSGRAGTDPRMLYSWYASDFCTDPAFADLPTPEERANPSMPSWGNNAYLTQQRRRLPAHKYRRLHLNLPGLVVGAWLSPDKLTDAITSGRHSLPPAPGVNYQAFVDMSGGSSDDATLAIGHQEDSRIVVDLVMDQGKRPPFNPREAVTSFGRVLRHYGIRSVTGDRYAGETFRVSFQEERISYALSPLSKTQLYEALEVPLNAGELSLPDSDKLAQQLLGLVWRGKNIDHVSGEHDDWGNAVAGVVSLFTTDAEPAFLTYLRREVERLQAQGNRATTETVR